MRSLAAGAALLLALGCGHEPVAPEVQSPDLGGVWTLILSAFGPEMRVFVIQADSAVEDQSEGPSVHQRVALWASLNRPPFRRDLTLEMSRYGLVMRWAVKRGDVVLGEGVGVVAEDPVYRVQRMKGHATFLWRGNQIPVEFDAFRGVPMPPKVRRESYAPPVAPVHAPAVVTLRMDDCRAQDAQAFAILQRLGLVAEVGVPTAWVGRPGSCDWDLVRAMALAGNSIEVHSRTHNNAPTSFGDFYLETVGALVDLRAQGYDPKIFIQPGSWNAGYPHFDRPWKLETPYGALLRRAFVAVEAYADTSRTTAFPAMGPDGAEAVPIRVFTPANLEAFLRDAATWSRWVHLSWHSFVISPTDLEARLKVVAALRDSGLIEVMPYASALVAKRSQ